VYEPLIEASVGFATYLAALQSGYAALVAIADDVDKGPLDGIPDEGP